jgi:hypothetical protein
VKSIRPTRLGSVLLAMMILCSVSSSNGEEVLEEVIEQNYPIDSNAKVNIANQDGSIRIYGANSGEMKLQAIKKAYTRDRLRKIDVKVSVRPGAVSIDTKYPPKPKWGLSDRSGTVDYVIILPASCDLQRVELANGEMLIEDMRGAEVHAQLGSGRMFGHNCFTDLQLTVGDGGLDVAYDWWESHNVALNTKIQQGNTRLFISGYAQFHLHAETKNGQVSNEFSGKDDRAPGARTKLDLTIGDEPNAEINLRAVDGSIRIREAYP